jgi:hypothetical protein
VGARENCEKGEEKRRNCKKQQKEGGKTKGEGKWTVKGLTSAIDSEKKER